MWLCRALRSGWVSPVSPLGLAGLSARPERRRPAWLMPARSQGTSQRSPVPPPTASAFDYLSKALKKNSGRGQGDPDWPSILEQLLDGRPMYDRVETDESIHPLLKVRKPVISTPKVKSVTPYNCEVFILKCCLKLDDLDAAMSYFTFLEEQGTNINSSHLLILIRLISRLDHDIPDQYHDRVMALIDPAQNLLFKARIAGETDMWYYLSTLANSRAWKQAHQIALTHLKPTSFRSSALETVNHLVRRLLEENRWDEALTLVRSPLFHQGLVSLHQKIPDNVDEVQSNVWVKLIKFCQIDHDHTKLEELFHIMREIDYFVAERVFRSFQLFYRNQTKYNICLVSVDKRGYCRQSKQQLPEFNLTPKEHEKLKSAVTNKVLKKSDVFQISDPKEMNQFQKFMSSAAEYDIVLDGLNIAFTYQRNSVFSNKNKQSNELHRVVEFCLNEGLRPLVITRPNVKQYACYNFLKENCEIQILSHVTEDDPFIIISALRRGPNVDFISNDTFRDHCLSLGESNFEAKRLFTKWQISRQRFHMIYPKNGKLIHDIKKPTMYQTNACQVNGDWYLPMRPEIHPKLEGRHFLLPPQKFLLIRRS